MWTLARVVTAKLDERTEVFGSGVLIIDSVRLHPLGAVVARDFDAS
jgi:hypothetical protein